MLLCYNQDKEVLENLTMKNIATFAVLLIGLTALSCGQTTRLLSNGAGGNVTSSGGTGGITGSAVLSTGTGSAVAISQDPNIRWATTPQIVWTDGTRAVLSNGEWLPLSSVSGGSAIPKHRHWKISEIKASAKPVDSARLVPMSYLVKAQRIHLESAATNEAEMLTALNDLGVKLYNAESVSQYLYDKAHDKGANVEWVWKPMRDLDANSFTQVGFSFADAFGGRYSNQLYVHAIPERVVSLASLVLEHMPDAKFLVSDYEVRKPDPFLAVTTAKMAAAGKFFIIAAWDEPGYMEPPSMEFGPTSARPGTTD